jgi:hypothetical protein
MSLFGRPREGPQEGTGDKNAFKELTMSQKTNGSDKISGLYNHMGISGTPHGRDNENTRLLAIGELPTLHASQLEATALLTREAFHAWENHRTELAALEQLIKTSPNDISQIIFGLCRRGIGLEAFKVCIEYLKNERSDLAIATLIDNSNRDYDFFCALQLEELNYTNYDAKATKTGRHPELVQSIFTEQKPIDLALFLGVYHQEKAKDNPVEAAAIYYTMLTEQNEYYVRSTALKLLTDISLQHFPKDPFLERVFLEYQSDEDLKLTIAILTLRISLDSDT